MPPDSLPVPQAAPQQAPHKTIGRLAGRPEAKPEPALIDLADLASLLGISRATAERMKSGAKLPPHLVLSANCHRWRRLEVLSWIEAGCPPKREWLARTGRGRAGV